MTTHRQKGTSASKTTSLWQGQEVRKTLEEAITDTIHAFYQTDAWSYDTWSIGYSGGKDSSALVTLLAYLFLFQVLPRPKRVIVHYADTGMEVPPLQQSALHILKHLALYGFETQVVHPELDERWFVYMLGRGIPLPSSGGMRWCTRVLKGDPMMAALTGETALVLTGVREGESVARDGRITAACSKDGGECGQGYMHVKAEEKGNATLAAILGWRVCHVFDWLSFYAPSPQAVFRLFQKQGFSPQYPESLNGGFDTTAIADIYGDYDSEDGQVEGLAARTGCMYCPLVTNPKDDHPRTDKMMQRVTTLPQYAYLIPLMKLLDLYIALSQDDKRLQRVVTRKNGMVVYPKGPLTMQARQWGLAQVKAIQEEVNMLAREQGMADISLISQEEEQRILALIEANTWPKGWTGTEPLASVFQEPKEEPDFIQPPLFDALEEEGKTQ
jgi:DNA sulfur modification protein DndC